MILQFFEKFDHPFSYFFLSLVTCFLRFTVSLLCRLQAISKKLVPIYPYVIEERQKYVNDLIYIVNTENLLAVCNACPCLSALDDKVKLRAERSIIY